jgi:formamidopyrimidine-DNA glycosylase
VPELLEVELYRQLATTSLDRPIAKVWVGNARVVGPPATVVGLRRALVGRRFSAARRRGKLLVLDTASPDGSRGPSLGVRFGMTGGLLVDDRAALDRLRHSAGHYTPKWVRFRIHFSDGGEFALHDPRRFGRVLLDPDEERLGPDAAAVTLAELRGALASTAPGGGPPLKARLLDQERLAGIGNLLADEILWRAALSPLEPSGSLSGAELRRLHRHLRATLDQLAVRGGSHTGDLIDERRLGGHCPRDGTALVTAAVGGRTTWWCPAHQR